MKKTTTKLAATPQPPAFQASVRKRVDRKTATATPTLQKRDNTFSKSRDTREDRGTRQSKTSNKSQTFSHGR